MEKNWCIKAKLHLTFNTIGSCNDLLPIWSKAFTQVTVTSQLLNSSSPGQNGRQFADNIFKHIFLNIKVRILVQISLKFVPKGPIDNNKSAMVQIMAWCRTGNKPLPEPMLIQFTNAYMRHKGEMSWSHSYLHSSIWPWTIKLSGVKSWDKYFFFFFFQEKHLKSCPPPPKASIFVVCWPPLILCVLTFRVASKHCTHLHDSGSLLKQNSLFQMSSITQADTKNSREHPTDINITFFLLQRCQNP